MTKNEKAYLINLVAQRLGQMIALEAPDRIQQLTELLEVVKKLPVTGDTHDASVKPPKKAA